MFSMLPKRKNAYFLAISFLICFSFLFGCFTFLLANNPSNHNSFQNSKSPTPPLYSLTNLTSSGTGKDFDYSETAWGTKSHNNLNETSSIVWETPDPWVGYYLNATVTDLEVLVSGTTGELANGAVEYNGSSQFSYLRTWFLDVIFVYNWQWDQSNELNFTLQFNTGVDPADVTQMDIITWSYSVDGPPQKKLVEYRIHNFTSGDNEYLRDAPEDAYNWGNHTINSGFTNYISGSGNIWLNFYAEATQGGSIGNYSLDYAAIILYQPAGWQPADPDDVGLVLDDGDNNNTVSGPTGYGTTSATPNVGNWEDNPKYFDFHSTQGRTLRFNATSTFWVSQDKLGMVSSTYYLNQSHSNPASHLWKLEFSQDGYPSVNFSKLNFSVSTIPIDWTMINATDPDQNPKTLDENSVPGGKSIYADTSDIKSTGGTWKIFYYSPNYISNLELRKTSILLSGQPNLLITDALDIRSLFLQPVLNGNLNLTISFEGQVNWNEDLTGISGLQRDFATWDIDSNTTKNGTYLITTSFYNTTEIGIYTRLITVIYPTNLSVNSPDIRFLEFLKGETINLTIFFENLYPGNYYSEWGIAGSQVKWAISNTTGYNETGDLTPLTPGYYNASIDTGSLGVWDGNYNLTVIANKTTYENQTFTFEMRCFETEHTTNATLQPHQNLAWVSGMNYTSNLFPNESILIELNFTDIYKSYNQLVDYANAIAFLYNSSGALLATYTTSGERIVQGYYRVNFSNLYLHSGQYTLLINVSKKFYINSSIWINYTIKELESIIRVSKIAEQNNISSTYYEWENLTFSFKVEYNATMYYEVSSWDSHIYWGLVRYFMVPYNGDPLNPADVIKSGVINMTPSGLFELRDIHLSNGSGLLPPSEYEIYVACNASDCKERWFNFNFTVLKKVNVSIINFNYPSQFIVDQPLSISAKLYASPAELPSPIYFNGKQVYFNITIYYSSAAPDSFVLSDTANQFGDIAISFNVKDYASNIEDVDHVEFFLYFNGDEDYYPGYSFYSAVSGSCSMTTTTPFDFTFIIYIILAVAAVATLLFIVQRKVIAPKQIQKTKSINYLFTSFKDVVGIQNLFVILKSSGDCILQKTYSPEGIDESMESVLCNVIANYGKGDQRHDASCDLIRYEKSIILMEDGEFIRTAVTVGERPSDKLIRSLVRFVLFFELQNHGLLAAASGPVEGLQGVDDLLDLQFGATLISPYTIHKISKVSGFDETLALMATSLMEGYGYFYLSQLYARAKAETLIDEMMIFGTIQNLMDKKVIVPYIATKKPKDISEKLAKTEFDRLKMNLFSSKNKALKAINASQFEDAVDYYHEAASFAASLGDLEAKNQLLGKAREYSTKVKPKLEPERIAKEVPEPIPMPILEPTSKSLPPIEKPAEPKAPTQLEEVMKKSKEMIASLEPTFATSAEDLLSEEQTDLTPFERALAQTTAADLLSEEPTPSIEEVITEPPEVNQEAELTEEALSILEEAVKVTEPPPEKVSLVDEVIKEAKISPEIDSSIIAKEIEAKTTQEEEMKIEEILTEIERVPIKEKPVPVEAPLPTLSETELKNLKKLFSETNKIHIPIPDFLWKLNSTVADISKQKTQTQRQVKTTYSSVMEKLKALAQHLLVPRKSIDEEVKIAEQELPKIIRDIDKVDQDAVQIKKNITSALKDIKNIKEKLANFVTKLTTVNSFLTKTKADEMVREKEEFQTLTTSYNETSNNLDKSEKELSGLNQEIVTLMIEDIEQMMAEEQNTEKIFNETSKKSGDSKKVQEAFSKENSKLYQQMQELTQIVILSETVSDEVLAQKQAIVSEVYNLENEFHLKLDEISQAIKDHSKDSLAISAECHVLQNKITQTMQNLQTYYNKIEAALKDLHQMDKIVSKIEKHKDRVEKVIEKTTKFVFPGIIQQQRTFFTEFNDNLQEFHKKGQEIRLFLSNEAKNVSQNLYPKLKPMPKTLQKIESKGVSATKEAEKFEADKFFQDLADSIDEEKPEIKEKPKPQEEGPLTDTDLGIKQKCPYCSKIIPENILTILRKGYKPECSNCGEIIKPSDVKLD